MGHCEFNTVEKKKKKTTDSLQTDVEGDPLKRRNRNTTSVGSLFFISVRLNTKEKKKKTFFKSFFSCAGKLLPRSKRNPQFTAEAVNNKTERCPPPREEQAKASGRNQQNLLPKFLPDGRGRWYHFSSSDKWKESCWEWKGLHAGSAGTERGQRAGGAGGAQSLDNNGDSTL